MQNNGGSLFLVKAVFVIDMKYTNSFIGGIMKRFLCTVALALSLSFVFSIDFPMGGDYAFRLTNPELLTSAGSAAGGGFYSSGPSSIINNPALTASEQRIMLNLGYTALFATQNRGGFGSGAQIALLIPSHWGVFTGILDGIFCNVGKLEYGNLLNLRGGFSKDITERLYAGFALSTGIRWADGIDWHLALDLGFVYHWGRLGFLKDFRIAGALTGLGKPYEIGMPSIATPKVGVAGTLFSVSNDNVAAGFSADLSFPMFVNMVLDAGLQLRIAKFITVKSGWQFDVRDTVNKNYNLLPSVGLTVRFGINTKENQFMLNKGWQQSEITVSGAWQKLYQDVTAISAGAAINLGLKDTEAPKIQLWDE